MSETRMLERDIGTHGGTYNDNVVRVDRLAIRRALERIAAGDVPVAEPSNYAGQGIRLAWQEAEVHREYAAHVLAGGDPEVGHGYGVNGAR